MALEFMKILSLIMAVLVGPSGLEARAAQSLGEVARQEEARRKQITPGKKYTNENLPAVPTSSAPDVRPPGGGGMSSPVAADSAATAKSSRRESSPAPADGAATPKAREKRDETYWRNRAGELRGVIEKVRQDITKVEARVKQLDHLQGTSRSPATARERDVAGGALDKLRQDLDLYMEEFKRFEEKARSAKVPPEWIQLRQHCVFRC